MKKLLGTLFIMALIFASDTGVYASSPYLSTFNNTYGTSTSKLNTCSLCHTSVPYLNPYGTDFLNNGHNFQAIEPLDSDGDGSTNIVEIEARTFPGDPTSIPSTPISLVAPNGGDAIPSGSTYTIQWIATSPAVQFKLKYSMDSGLTWIPITTNFVGGASYNWTVPAPTDNKKICLIKVIAYDGSGMKLGTDSSNTPFQIVVVKLASPNVGLTYRSGDPLTITWSNNATKNPVAEVNLFYTKDGGVNWYPITTLTGNAASYSWTVPTVTKAKSMCKVKVELRDAYGNILGKDASDSYFTIQP
jgi:hypothetical protein